MICAGCQRPLTETGIAQVARIWGIAYLRHNPDKDTWSFTGESEADWDDEQHQYFACTNCGQALTDEQEKALTVR